MGKTKNLIFYSLNCGPICFVFVFAFVVGKNQNTPNLSPMADDAITRAVHQVWDLLCTSVGATHTKAPRRVF